MKQTIKSAVVLLLAMSSTAVWAQGLKDAYKKEFMIGVAVNGRNVSNPEQMALIKKEFNSITAENDMKPQPTEPKEGQFNWEAADRIANFARQNLQRTAHPSGPRCQIWHCETIRGSGESPTIAMWVHTVLSASARVLPTRAPDTFGLSLARASAREG